MGLSDLTPLGSVASLSWYGYIRGCMLIVSLRLKTVLFRDNAATTQMPIFKF